MREERKCTLEACVGTIESALEAEKGGADRIELCDDLIEGGTTPSFGMICMAKDLLKIDTAVMIRPRHGDFLYSDNEFEIMKKDIELCRKIGVKAVVFGILLPEGEVDMTRTKQLVEIAGKMQVCFHRAVDLCKDMSKAVCDIIECGCDRILTSGGKNKAIDGIGQIELIHSLYSEQIEIMVGSGIDKVNAERFKQIGIRHFHLSGKGEKESGMTFRKPYVSMGGISPEKEYVITQTDCTKIALVKKVLQN